MIYAEIATILQPGKMETYHQLEQDVHPHVEAAGYKLVGTWRTTIGNSNEITTMLSAENMERYEKAASVLAQDKEYQVLMQKMASITVNKSIKLMRPNPSSPMK
jgi:hypothetical protein